MIGGKKEKGHQTVIKVIRWKLVQGQQTDRKTITDQTKEKGERKTDKRQTKSRWKNRRSMAGNERQ